MWHDARIGKGGAKLAQGLLGGTDLINVANLEREVVETSATRLVPTGGLLPEGKDERAILLKEGEAAPLLPGLAPTSSPKRAGRAPWSDRRSDSLAQADVAGLERAECGCRQERLKQCWRCTYGISSRTNVSHGP